jgi:hypothetical protein
MREGLAIRAAISGDIDAFTPSAAQTSAVFSELGFTAPHSNQQASSKNIITLYVWVPLLWLLGGLCMGGALAHWFTQSQLKQQFADEKRNLEQFHCSITE